MGKRILAYLLAPFLAAAAEPATLSGVRQLNQDGFGTEDNKYALSMEVYRGALYVGTLNIKGMLGMLRFATGATARFLTGGGEVWRYDTEGRWSRVVAAGLENRHNLGVRKLKVVGDCLYGVTANHDQGMEVWRTRDGERWEAVSRRGFGQPGNTSGRGLGWFKGMIYVGTENRKTGAEIWRSADGLQWERVVNRGGGDPRNVWFSDLFEFQGRLYAGTLNMRGMQLFASRDGSRFEPVFKGGLDKATNVGALKLLVFQDRLYVGTMDYSRGFDLYRTADGVHFERVLENGHTSRYNAYLWQMEEYHGRLYAGIYDYRVPLPRGRFQLYSSADGKNWAIETADGFGNLWHYGARTLAVFQDRLIIGTASARYGCKVFAAELAR
ncbi:MAG: hypothetical protein HZA91_05410 [Verrucomicrobia bacterium]|nr:hypothetical protein [Verrucomicrobiota bacterium]